VAPSFTGRLALHHVGVVVADLDAAVEQYRALGFGDGERFTIAEQQIEAVLFRAGSGFVELIHPLDAEGPIARFLAKRGNTVHHLAFQVTDIGAEMQRLQDEGARLIDSVPRTGAHDWRIAFVHPESCGGVLVELVEVGAGEN
jgi:methylmalonyl-CoA/ethylmalonyl-CoA epimerase